MKYSLKLEQFAFFVALIYIYFLFNFSWWTFAFLFFVPDLMMIGYLFGNKVGAICYNSIHHYATTILLFFIGYLSEHSTLMMVGIIFSAHIAFDRVLSYGLKKSEGFKFTHLGNL